jgi:hypothetical protein
MPSRTCWLAQCQVDEERRGHPLVLADLASAQGNDQRVDVPSRDAEADAVSLSASRVLAWISKASSGIEG